MAKDAVKLFEKQMKKCRPYEAKALMSNSYGPQLAVYINSKISNQTLDLNIYTEENSRLRNSRFQIATHFGKYAKDLLKEKPLCRSWFNCPERIPKNLKRYGTVIDYETNLIEGSHVNIDLVSYDGKDFYLWEVKGTGTLNDKTGLIEYSSDETLVRALLEVETYYQTIVNNGNEETFKSEIGGHLFDISNREQASIKKLVVIPRNSKIASQISDPNCEAIRKHFEIIIEEYDPVFDQIDKEKTIRKTRKTL